MALVIIFMCVVASFIAGVCIYHKIRTPKVGTIYVHGLDKDEEHTTYTIEFDNEYSLEAVSKSSGVYFKVVRK